ncbi:MAG TPA: oligosaccharide flippase family protein [Pyrinomonadaceae bacterium]
MSEAAAKSTTRSITKNVFYGFTSWILPFILTFFATRLIVKTLGNHEYGIYSLVLGFIGYSFVFSIGRAITKYVAEYQATGESRKIKDVISATFFINLVLGLVGIVSVFLLSGWLVSDVLNIEAEAHARTVTALYIAATAVFFTLFTQVFSAIVQGLHRFDIYSKILNFSSISMLLGNLIIAWLGGGLIALFSWNLFITCATCALFYASAKRLLPDFSITHRFNKDALKLVVGFSAGVVGYQVLGNIWLLFERIWITRQLGAESLTFYAVPMTVSFQIQYFIASLVIVIFPLASELQNDREKLERLYTKATKIISMLVVFIATTIIVHSRLFLSLWMGAEFADASTNLLIIHTVSFSLVAILTVSWQMTEGLGYPNFYCYLYVLCLLISIPLMIFLSYGYGNEGVAIGRLVGYAVSFLSIIYVEKWFFKRILAGFWLNILGRLLFAAAAAVLVEMLSLSYLPYGWLSLFTSSFLGGIIYLSVLWLLGFVTEDEKILARSVFGK